GRWHGGVRHLSLTLNNGNACRALFSWCSQLWVAFTITNKEIGAPHPDDRIRRMDLKVRVIVSDGGGNHGAHSPAQYIQSGAGAYALFKHLFSKEQAPAVVDVKRTLVAKRHRDSAVWRVRNQSVAQFDVHSYCGNNACATAFDLCSASDL